MVRRIMIVSLSCLVIALGIDIMVQLLAPQAYHEFSNGVRSGLMDGKRTILYPSIALVLLGIGSVYLRR